MKSSALEYSDKYDVVFKNYHPTTSTSFLFIDISHARSESTGYHYEMFKISIHFIMQVKRVSSPWHLDDNSGGFELLLCHFIAHM